MTNGLIKHLIAFALLITTAPAAEVKIEAPATAPAKAFVVIDASASKATDCLQWAIADHSLEVWYSVDRTKLLVYAPEPRQVAIVLIARDRDGKSAAGVHDLKFTGDDPAPKPPKPTPKPDGPGKVLPAGKYAISQPAYDEARKVDTPDRPGDAAHVITAMEAVRAKIASGTIPASDTFGIIGELRKSRSTMPAEVRKRWDPWGNWWGKFLYEIYRKGQLATQEQWLAVIDETILGLKSVN